MMTELENNHIGVQTKDNSKSLIAQSALKNNLIQTDAYQKTGNMEVEEMWKYLIQILYP